MLHLKCKSLPETQKRHEKRSKEDYGLGSLSHGELALPNRETIFSMSRPTWAARVFAVFLATAGWVGIYPFSEYSISTAYLTYSSFFFGCASIIVARHVI